MCVIGQNMSIAQEPYQKTVGLGEMKINAIFFQPQKVVTAGDADMARRISPPIAGI